MHVHETCIDPHYKSLINCSELSKNPFEFRCQACIACASCGTREPGQGGWSKDFKQCVPCEKKRDKKMYCGGCLKFLPDVLTEEYRKEKLIKCIACQMQIHKSCDRMLEDPQILAKFDEQNAQSGTYTLYTCVSCR